MVSTAFAKTEAVSVQCRCCDCKGRRVVLEGLFLFFFFFFSSSSSHLVEHTNFVLAALRAIGVGAGVAVV
jgi:hypothetical protein